jgi:hypothetical protein
MGIAVAMALALTAFVGAASASASVFQTEGAGATDITKLTGTRGVKAHVLGLGNESFSCETVGFSGQWEGAEVSEATVTPELSGCVNFPYSSVGWQMNGCKYRFHPGTGTTTQTVGTVDIAGCEKPMSINTGGCIREIGNQNGIGTVEYKDTTVEGHTVVMVIAKMTGITYSRNTSGACPGSGGTFNNGTYTGEWKMAGSGGAKNAPMNIKVLGTPPPPPTHFTAEEAPVTIVGTGSTELPKRIVPLGGNGVTCTKYTLNGTMASTSATTITLVPTYKECTVNTEPVPDGFVNAGSCSFVFHLNGELDVVGAECASKPLSATRAGCIATIGPQSGLVGFGYANLLPGSGKSRSVSMSGNTGEHVTYNVTGPSCFMLGTFGNGRILSNAELKATNSKGEAQGLWLE